MTMHVQLDRISQVLGRRRIRALSDITATFHTGVYGIVGPNGAGKTTLLRILATLLPPTSGGMQVNGADIADPAVRRDFRAQMGYMPQQFGLFRSLTGMQFLEYLASVRRLPPHLCHARALSEVAGRAGVVDLLHRPMGSYSGGMQRRMGLAQALLGAPQVLLLDEPTVGLDPAERMRVHGILVDLGQAHLLVISTHLMEDVARLCSRVLLLNEGALIFAGSPAHLANRDSGGPQTAVPSADILTEAYIHLLTEHLEKLGQAVESTGKKQALTDTDTGRLSR